MRFDYRNLAIFTLYSLCMANILMSASPAAAQSVSAPDGMPERWLYTGEYSQTSPVDDQWWRQFNDPVLDSLISLGVANNYNLLAAQKRIGMAAQAIAQARSRYYPVLSANAGWTASRSSGMTTSHAMDASSATFFSLGASMSWEIDVFGRVKAQAEGNEAAYRASRADYDATMVTVAANIATAYMQLRTLQAQLEVLQRHIAQQKRVTDITEARHEAGLASMLDVTQARTVYYSTMASETAINTSISTTINAIAVLLGVYPEQLAPYLATAAPMPDYRQIVAVGVPLELLRRRPDIVEAECRIAQYAAALGVAEKDFLPVLSLNGSIGTSAHDITDMFDSRAFTYTVAPTLSWTIFDGKGRRATEESARLQMQAGIDAYNSTVLTAVQEVDNAMVTYTNSLKYIDMLTQVVDTSEQSFNLSIDLYKQGLTAFINVENAQISYLQYANEMVNARGQALAALVNLYQALGGGWSAGD